jgi:hypothetical protein
MAHREFDDGNGVHWQVWEVIPQSVERRALRERRIAPRDARERRKRHEVRLRVSNGAVPGWLVFESDHMKRRLRPIPHAWFDVSDSELESMCARAELAARPTPRLIE